MTANIFQTISYLPFSVLLNTSQWTFALYLPSQHPIFLTTQSYVLAPGCQLSCSPYLLNLHNSVCIHSFWIQHKYPSIHLTQTPSLFQMLAEMTPSTSWWFRALPSTRFETGEHHRYMMPEILPFNPPARAVSFRARKVSFPTVLSDLVWRTGCEQEDKVSTDSKDESWKHVGAHKY